MKTPTVSQIISYSKDKESVERLRVWKENNPEAAKTTKQNGSSFASLVDLFFKKKIIDKNHGNEFFIKAENYLKSIKEPVASEMDIYYHSSMPYRGRLDLLTKSTLIEFKTRNSQKALCNEALRDYHLQVAAYSIALNSMGFDTQYLQRQIVLIYKDANPLIIGDSDLDFWENEFKVILEKYYRENFF